MPVIQVVLSHLNVSDGQPLVGEVNHTLNGRRCRFRLIQVDLVAPNSQSVNHEEVPLALDFITFTQSPGDDPYDPPVYHIVPSSTFRRDYQCAPVFQNVLSQGFTTIYPGTEAGRIFLPSRYTDVTNGYTYTPSGPFEFTGLCLGNSFALMLTTAANPPGTITTGFTSAENDATRFSSGIVTFDVEAL